MGRRVPLVRQHSVPLTPDVRAKLLEARSLNAGQDVGKRDGALQDVDASSLGVRLHAWQSGSRFLYSVSQVLHAALSSHVREGDVLLMVGQTHVTNKSPSEVEQLCRVRPDPKGAHMVFSTRHALEEEDIDEVEFINLRVCFNNIICVQAQVLWCRRRQGAVQLLRTGAPSRRVPRVGGSYVQLDSHRRLRLLTAGQDHVDSRDSRLKVELQEGHCDLDGPDTVYLLSLALHMEDGSTLYFAAQQNCVGGSLPLKFQAVGGPPFQTEGARQSIRPDARCAVFVTWQAEGGLLLRPIDFPDVTVCVEDDVLVGKTVQGPAAPSDRALFDFLPAELGSSPDLPVVLPESPDPASTDSGSVRGSDGSESSPDTRPPQPLPQPPRDHATQSISRQESQKHATPSIDSDVTPSKVDSDVTPSKVDNDVTPPRENDVTPASTGGDVVLSTEEGNAVPPDKGDDVTPSKESSDVTPSKVDSDVTPPKQDGDVTPSKVDSDVTPSEGDSDVTPSKRDSDVIPSKEDSDVNPHKEDSGVTPSKKDSDATPSQGDSDVTPSNEEGDLTPQRKDDDVPPQSGDRSPLMPTPPRRRSTSSDTSESSSDSSESESDSACMPCLTSALKSLKKKKLRFHSFRSRRRSVRSSC